MATLSTTLVWFHRDLRCYDHEALWRACETGASGDVVIPVFIWAPEEEEPWAPGGATRWWWHESLKAFAKKLSSKNSKLILRQGPTLTVLQKLIQETGATAVVWSRRYEPALIERDRHIKETLKNEGIEVHSYNGLLLNEPWTIQNQSKRPFQVFTPYWKHCLKMTPIDKPFPEPQTIPSPKIWPSSSTLEELGVDPPIHHEDWKIGFREHWQPGEDAAWENLESFLDDPVLDYGRDRDVPSKQGTSRLSPHLHFGEISPRAIRFHIHEKNMKDNRPGFIAGYEKFLSEIGWREFAYHLLYHFPHTPLHPLRAEFEKFPWEPNKKHLKAWQKGRTGYPIVDAGLRELWKTGWMHNRVRMIVASFLVKDIFIPWQEGAKWFWDTLVDADLASNTLGWQWVSGCGADAAPYFRIFNPMTQGMKFDADGEYVRRWVPEIAGLPDKWVHQPWEAPEEELRKAGIQLGKTYPNPIVVHAESRVKALSKLKMIQ